MSTTTGLFRRSFIIITIISLLSVTFWGTTTFAQEGEVPPGPSLPPEPPAPEGTVNCFDYYKFGSVQADLSTVLPETIPGVPLTFTGNLTNENPYPVVNGSLYVKIFKTDGQDESDMKANGYPLVAFFEAGENIQIPGKSSIPYTFDWDVPLAIQGGDYSADFFFVTDDRFNLLGLSFTDDVTGNKTSFSIAPENDTQVTFNKNRVTLNGDQYSFAAFPPHFIQDEPVTVSVPVTNPADQERIVSLEWKLYAWDGLRSENLLDTHTEVMVLKPGETKNVAYTATTYGGAVSYIIATLTDQDAQSIINPRFVRDGISEVRLNYPSLFSFPIEEGKEQTLFSCAHSTNMPIVPDNTITMTLTDLETNDVIHTYTYQGGITGAMMGVKDTFTPGKSYGKVALTTELKHGMEVIDSVTQTYDCAALGIDCPSKSIFASIPTMPPGPHMLYYVFTSLAALALLYFILERRRGFIENKTNLDMKMPIAPLVFLFITMATFGVQVGEVGAVKTAVPSSVSGIPALAYWWNFSPVTNSVPLSTERTCTNSAVSRTGQPITGCGWSLGLYSGAYAYINYDVKMVNVTPGDPNNGREIPDGASVVRGTQVKLMRDTTNTTDDIFWAGTGRSNDSPYGRWVANAGPVSDACVGPRVGVDSLYIYGAGAHVYFDTYILLNVAPPSSITADSNNSRASCSGDVCTVNEDGPISLRMNISDTIGRFYYRYNERDPYNISNWDGCHANNVPMHLNTVAITGLPALITPTSPTPPGLYTLNFPATYADFTLTGVNPNRPPTKPSITGPLAVNTGSTHSYNITGGTDPDGDPVRYGIDWGSGSVTEYSPSTGYTAAGAHSVSRTWPSTARTYTVRVGVEDNRSSGWVWSDPITVTATTPLPPTTRTLPATGETTTSITLNGGVNPNGTAATGAFRWSTTPGTCSATFGTRVVATTPASGDVGSGNTERLTAYTLSGLSANTTYYFCAEGSSTHGTTYGTVLSTRTTNSLPTAEIITPAAPTTITIGTPITFEGRGTDPDGDTAFTYDWRDGSCGAGGTQLGTTATLANVDTSIWSIGDHTINFRVTDSAGGSSRECDTVTITILPPPIPDLTIDSFTVPSGPYTKGTAINLSGVVRNSGGVTTGTGFSDNFTYRWNTTDAWQEITLIPHMALAPNATANDATTFTPDRAGTLYLQYCVDATQVIYESGAGGESNNCRQLPSLTVVDPTDTTKSATINNTPCLIPRDSNRCTTDITWNSTNLSNPTVRLNNSSVFATGESGTQSHTITRDNTDSSDTFRVHDGGPISNELTVNASCAPGTTWNSTDSLCRDGVPVTTSPSLRAAPRIVEEGRDTTLTWNTGGVPESNCTLYGGDFGATGRVLPDDGNFIGSLPTPVYANTTYRLVCPAVAEASVRVEVIPRYFPS